VVINPPTPRDILGIGYAEKSAVDAPSVLSPEIVIPSADAQRRITLQSFRTYRFFCLRVYRGGCSFGLVQTAQCLPACSVIISNDAQSIKNNRTIYDYCAAKNGRTFAEAIKIARFGFSPPQGNCANYEQSQPPAAYPHAGKLYQFVWGCGFHPRQ
jgi:hypothetical protein